MTIEDLHDLLTGAPTGGAESSALVVLRGLARDSNLAAARTLVGAVARAAGCDEAVDVLTPIDSFEGLLAADLPAPFGAYAAALQPRTLLANAKRLATRPDGSDDAAMSAFRRLILSRDVLQHDVLRAHILSGVAGMCAMLDGIDSMTPGQLLPIVDLVFANGRVIEGRDCDASLNFGREKLLNLRSLGELSSIIGHELGHNVFDLLRSGGGAVRAVVDAAQLRAFGAAVSRLMEAACRRRGKAFEPGDARAFRATNGVQMLCTHEQRAGGSYFHLSLMQGGGAIDLQTGATYAYFALAIAGIERARAAVAWSPRGALHFGFRGDDQDVPGAAPSRAAVTARAKEAVAEAQSWIEELRVNRRLGGSEADIAMALEVEPRRPRAYARDFDTAFNDLKVVAEAEELPSLDALTEPQAFAVLASAWRSAAATVVQRLLREHDSVREQLRTANWPLGEIGASVLALRKEAGEVSVHGPTALHIRAVLQELRDAGVPLERPADDDGRTLLGRAVFKGPDHVRLALACGLDPNRPCADGETPILACAVAGSIAAAEVLADAGASLESRDPQGRTPLHQVVRNGRQDFLHWLVARGANVNAQDGKGETPLMLAATPRAVAALCDAGASVHAATVEGVTALHFAAARGSSDVLHALLERGAEVDAATRANETPLHYAAMVGAGTDCLAALVDAGADIEEETNEGLTPLMVAARTAQLDAVDWLIARGAGVDARTLAGNTALILASDGRNEWTRDFSFNDRLEQCLRRLAAAGADVNATNDAGFTALHAATWGFDAGRVQCLIELGANPATIAHDGSTPLSVAKAKEHHAMIEALEAARS